MLAEPFDSGFWCREPESNWRHRDFQSRALPTELSRPDAVTRLVARRLAENTTALRPGGSPARAPAPRVAAKPRAESGLWLDQQLDAPVGNDVARDSRTSSCDARQSGPGNGADPTIGST